MCRFRWRDKRRRGIVVPKVTEPTPIITAPPVKFIPPIDVFTFSPYFTFDVFSLIPNV